MGQSSGASVVERLNGTIERLKGFNDKVTEVIKETLKENETVICELNSQDQLFEQGITRDNTKISDYAPYSPYTVMLKQLKGAPTSRVTLRDEGDFHRSFYIEFEFDGFKIRASDWKEEDLVKSYGKKILGLTDENFLEVRDTYITPAIKKLMQML
jgi:hypothetical protein